MMSERPAVWRDEVIKRLDHLCRLTTGWDGYNGRPVGFSTANFALNILERVCDAETPTPSIVPGTSGDLQIEWHTRVWDLEVDVAKPFCVHAWRRHATSGEEAEIPLTNDFSIVGLWLREISELSIAPDRTAA